MPTYELTFSKVIMKIVSPSPATATAVIVPAGCVWKIESAGIGGTNGAIFLLNNASPDPEKIAILATSIGDDDYAAPLPYWLEENFSGYFSNESSYKGSVSITEFVISTLPLS
jgi:hypothetical protein